SKSSPREGQKGFRAPWKCVGFVPPSIALSLLMSPKDNLKDIEKTQLRIPPSFRRKNCQLANDG
ncbi:unnamed protein product, partial [Thlaspi arvense]